MTNRICNRLYIERLINDLEKLRSNPKLYLQPVTPEALFSHLSSLALGVMLTTDVLQPGDFINARREANRISGWQSRATGPHVEMREKGMTDEQIIDEQVNVEIRMWRILEEWQVENERLEP